MFTCMICYSRCIFHIARYGMPAWLPSAEFYCWWKAVCIWDTAAWTSPKTLLLPYRYRNGQEEARQSNYPVLWNQYWNNYCRLFIYLFMLYQLERKFSTDWDDDLFIKLFIYLLIYLSICLSVCLSTYLHAIIWWYTLSYMFWIKSSGRITQDKRQM